MNELKNVQRNYLRKTWACRLCVKLTQKNLVKKLSIGQEGVSRLEQHSNLMLSTLRNLIEAMGGKLRITAEFPYHTPVNLSGFSNPTKHR